MKIAVISGSPKGSSSITLQSALYLAKRFPAHQFEIHHIGQQIKSLEKHEKMSLLVDRLLESDCIFWVYPVFTLLAPYQLHRFIELLKAHPEAGGLAGKWSTQLTTSKNFYDFTAHRYIDDNAEDLGLKVLRGLSANMDDLLSEKGQQELLAFWNYIEFQTREPTVGVAVKPGKKEFDTLILTCADGKDSVLAGMIESFQKAYAYPTRVINLKDLRIDGGCLGCFNCATDGQCIYKDGFDQVLRERIQTADAIVYAAGIKDHSLGAAFKMYEDRQFCNGHRTVTMGMPIAYLLAGNYAAEPNLRMVLEGRSDVGHQFLVGVASTGGTRSSPSPAIEKIAKSMAYALENKMLFPQNFLGIGGMKVFRDLIYVMKGLMRADHRFYKAKGFYDFPQKQVRVRLKMHLIGMLMAVPFIRKNMKSKMGQAILQPYRKVIDAFRD